MCTIAVTIMLNFNSNFCYFCRWVPYILLHKVPVTHCRWSFLVELLSYVQSNIANSVRDNEFNHKWHVVELNTYDLGWSCS